MSIAIITTVKNEEKSIRNFLDSLVHQTAKADEIIITDGGSMDNTCEIILTEYIPRFPYMKLIREKCNIAKGRNIAIRRTTCTLIAVTDAGCRVSHDWLNKLMAPLEYDGSIDVVGGITVPDAATDFEKITGQYFTVPVKFMQKDQLWVSSRNIAFRKSIWDKVGGYPEWLYLSGEDTLFNSKLHKVGAKIHITPESIVYWKPMGNFKKLFTQTFTYSRGNGQVGSYKYFISKTISIYLIMMGLFMAGFFAPACWVFLGAISLLYFLQSGVKICLAIGNPHLLLLAMAVKGVMDIANISGYPVGLFFRLKSHDD